MKIPLISHLSKHKHTSKNFQAQRIYLCILHLYIWLSVLAFFFFSALSIIFLALILQNTRANLLPFILYSTGNIRLLVVGSHSTNHTQHFTDSLTLTLSLYRFLVSFSLSLLLGLSFARNHVNAYFGKNST